jgi:hypothetical protein
MPPDDTIEGTASRSDTPNWEPLTKLIGTRLADWFMWMFDIVLADGVRVHAYKHTATRRSMHLAEDGRAFVFVGGERYREIRSRHAIDEAVAGWESLWPLPDDIVAHAGALRLASDLAGQRESLEEDR